MWRHGPPGSITEPSHGQIEALLGLKRAADGDTFLEENQPDRAQDDNPDNGVRQNQAIPELATDRVATVQGHVLHMFSDHRRPR
jgi:hypothetical protein